MQIGRQGFTLVEVLVALTLLAIGVAGWVGTSTVAIRAAGAAGRTMAAQGAVRTGAARLAARRCPEAGAGEDAATRWQVRVPARGVRAIRVEARDSLAGRPPVAEVITWCG